MNRLVGESSGIIEVIRQATEEGLQVKVHEDIELIRDELMNARKEVLELFKGRKDGKISTEEYNQKYEEYSRRIIELEDREKTANEQTLQKQLAQRRLKEAYELLVDAANKELDVEMMRKLVDVIKVNSKHELEFQFKCGVDIIETV